MKKTCTKCKLEKNLDQFHKKNKLSNSYRAQCKICTNMSNRKRWALDSENRKIQKKEYRAKNIEKVRARIREHYYNNKEKYYLKSVNRRKRLQQATITGEPWSAVVSPFRKIAKKMTEETGVKHVVDHIMPIRGKNSCGLNVPWNLRVITEKENQSKGNKEIKWQQ